MTINAVNGTGPGLNITLRLKVTAECRLSDDRNWRKNFTAARDALAMIVLFSEATRGPARYQEERWKYWVCEHTGLLLCPRPIRWGATS